MPRKPLPIRPPGASVEYTAAEAEFLREVEAWKKKHRCQFPTAVELLRIAVGMGYQKE